MRAEEEAGKTRRRRSFWFFRALHLPIPVVLGV